MSPTTSRPRRASRWTSARAVRACARTGLRGLLGLIGLVGLAAPSRGATPFGHGVLCVAPPVLRGAAGLSGDRGRVALRFAAAASLPVHAGETWHFQIWYRNQGLGPPFFNLTDALSVVFCP